MVLVKGSERHARKGKVNQMEKINIKEYLREKEAERARVLKRFALTEEEKILKEIESEEAENEIRRMVNAW